MRYLTNIHCFTEGFLFIDVNEDDLGSHTGNGEGVGDGCADVSCADNCDLVAHNINPLLFLLYFK